MGVPADAWTAARSTLGAASAAATTLPADVGVPLLDAARAAFVRGLQITALLGAFVMGGAVVIAALLRHQTARA